MLIYLLTVWAMDKYELKRAIDFFNQNNKPCVLDFYCCGMAPVPQFVYGMTCFTSSTWKIFAPMDIIWAILSQLMPSINGCCLLSCSHFCTKMMRRDKDNNIIWLTRN
jgi:hypothetical protein